MENRRFDALTRALGRRGSRRSAVAAVLFAVVGGVAATTADTNAVVCAGRGASCAGRSCCAGHTCDPRKKTCLALAGSACVVASHCASGLKCKRSKCVGATVCRTITQSCNPGADGCCANLDCGVGTRTCIGQLGAVGCRTDRDCIDGLVCRGSVCSSPPPPDPCPLADGAEFCILFADYSRVDLCGISVVSQNNNNTGSLCYANSDCQDNCHDEICKCQIGWNEGNGVIYLTDDDPDGFPNGGGVCTAFQDEAICSA